MITVYQYFASARTWRHIFIWYFLNTGMKGVRLFLDSLCWKETQSKLCVLFNLDLTGSALIYVTLDVF